MEWNNAFELPLLESVVGKSKFGYYYCYVGVIVNAYLTSLSNS